MKDLASTNLQGYDMVFVNFDFSEKRLMQGGKGKSRLLQLTVIGEERTSLSSPHHQYK
jgi:hypothetical protein